MYNNRGIRSNSTATINSPKYILFVVHDFTIEDTVENWKRVEPVLKDEAELHKCVSHTQRVPDPNLLGISWQPSSIDPASPSLMTKFAITALKHPRIVSPLPFSKKDVNLTLDNCQCGQCTNAAIV